MTETILFGESVACTLEDQTQRTIEHTESDEFEAAAAIINEWTTDDDSCILTNYLQENLASVTSELLYVTFKDGDVAYGTFSFTTSPELPTDNI